MGDAGRPWENPEQALSSNCFPGNQKADSHPVSRKVWTRFFSRTSVGTALPCPSAGDGTVTKRRAVSSLPHLDARALDFLVSAKISAGSPDLSMAGVEDFEESFLRNTVIEDI